MPRETKDSGIEWIGEIPSTWKLCKIKHVCSTIGSGTTPKSGNLEFYENGTINWIQSGDLYNKATLTNVSTLITKRAFSSTTSLKLYIAPYIVIAMYGASVGNTAISTIDACTNQACCCLKPNISTHLKYLFYWINHCKSDFLDKAEGGTQPNISQQKIANQYFLQPSFSEQQLIANFLDYKCNEIDALHADIEKQIATLEDYKKSVITEAVTKGLNPDIEMKDSGSTYWNTIPNHWNLSDIKYLFEIVKRIAGKEGFDILSVTQKGLKIKDISNNEGQIAESYANYQFVYPNDFVMNHMDLLTGWVDCSQYFGVTSPDYRVFRLRNQANNLSYYKYVMQVCYMNKIFYSLGQGVSTLGRWRLQTSSFNNFQIPVPPISEQQEIADYLDQKTTEIDSIISAKKQQLDVLENYKKSLIYEYVTGKKEVPSYANAE